MRKSLKYEILLIVGLIIGLVGCKNAFLPEGTPVASLIETQIPGFENLSATPTNLEIFFPRVLGCNEIELDAVRPGFTWRNIQIGVTTFDEMLAELSGEGADIYISFSESSVSFKFHNRTRKVEPYWDLQDACFIGDVLVALRNPSYNEDFPLKLPDIIEKYGKPDVVTWGHNYWHRSLIWLDLGILIEIELEYDENVNVYLFPPISEAKFEDSWMNNILPKSIEGWEDPELIDELGRLPRRKEREDPWGFTEWWRIFN